MRWLQQSAESTVSDTYGLLMLAVLCIRTRAALCLILLCFATLEQSMQTLLRNTGTGDTGDTHGTPYEAR